MQKPPESEPNDNVHSLKDKSMTEPESKASTARSIDAVNSEITQASHGNAFILDRFEKPKKGEEVIATLIELGEPVPLSQIYATERDLLQLYPADGSQDPSEMLDLIVNRNGNLQKLPEGK